MTYGKVGIMNTFTDSQLLGCVNDVLAHGGAVTLGPVDPLNPGSGFSVVIETRHAMFRGFHGGYDPRTGHDYTPNAIEALRDAITKAQPQLWPSMRPEGT